jgi:hypothetical protein
MKTTISFFLIALSIFCNAQIKRDSVVILKHFKNIQQSVFIEKPKNFLLYIENRDQFNRIHFEKEENIGRFYNSIDGSALRESSISPTNFVISGLIRYVPKIKLKL